MPTTSPNLDKVPAAAEPAAAWRTHLRWLTVLLAAALVARMIAASTCTAPARDAFRYWRAAQSFDDLPAWKAAAVMDSHPLYPYSLHLVRRLLLAVGLDGPFAWWRASQALSILCSLAFLALAYAAGTIIWSPRVSALGCLAIAVTPRQVSYAVDVLSDNLHALLWMAGFLCLLSAWKRPTLGLLTAAGAFAGLAHWTHLQALLLPATFAASVVLTQAVACWRWPWKTCAVALAGFAVGYGVVGGSYMAIVGGLSPREAAGAVLGNGRRAEVKGDLRLRRLAREDPPQQAPSAVIESKSVDELVADGRLPARASRREVYDETTFAPAVVLLGKEVGEETRSWLILLASAAFFRGRFRNGRFPAGLLVFVAFAGGCAMQILLKMRGGYLAGRYLTPVLPFIGMLAMAEVDAWLQWLAARPPLRWETARAPDAVSRYRVRTAAIVLAGILLLLCASGWFRPLHRERFGHLQAARWLAQRSEPQDVIYDLACYSAFFANRSTWLPEEKLVGPPPVRYAVVDPTMIDRSDDFNRRAYELVQSNGRLVAAFPDRPSGRRIGVYVFELSPDQASRSASNPR